MIISQISLLYDVKSKSFFDSLAKENCWKDIRMELGATASPLNCKKDGILIRCPFEKVWCCDDYCCDIDEYSKKRYFPIEPIVFGFLAISILVGCICYRCCHRRPKRRDDVNILYGLDGQPHVVHNTPSPQAHPLPTSYRSPSPNARLVVSAYRSPSPGAPSVTNYRSSSSAHPVASRSPSPNAHPVVSDNRSPSSNAPSATNFRSNARPLASSSASSDVPLVVFVYRPPPTDSPPPIDDPPPPYDAPPPYPAQQTSHNL